MKILILLMVVILIGFAVREKVKQKVRTSSASGMPEEIRSSPVSQALAELVAIAGGGISIATYVNYLFRSRIAPKNEIGFCRD